VSADRTGLIVALALGLAAAAFGVGALGFPEMYFITLAFIGLGVWVWLRQRQLENLSFLQRAMRGFAAYAIIGFSLLIAFELGQLVGGHT